MNCVPRLLSIFRPRHTFAAVLGQLVNGLEDGTILLDLPRAEGKSDALDSLGTVYLRPESVGAAGIEYAHAGQFKEAAKAFEAMLTHSGEVSQRTKAATLFNLGTVHALQDESLRAIDRYKQAFTLYRSLEDNLAMLRTLSRLGAVYLVRNENSIALVILEEAIALSERIGDVSERGIIYYNLVSTYLKLNEIDRATAVLKKMAALTSVAPGYDSVQTNPAFAHRFEWLQRYVSELTRCANASFTACHWNKCCCPTAGCLCRRWGRAGSRRVC